MKTKTKNNTNSKGKGGPRTKEGKDKSRLNATKHGFFSKLITKHDLLDDKEFAEAMYDFIAPENVYQSQLLEILMSNILSFSRLSMIESTLIENELDEILDEPVPILALVEYSGYKLNFQSNFLDELNKFQRYKTSALNSIIRTKNAIDKSKNQ